MYLWVCVCVDRWGLGGLGSCDSHTHTHTHTHAHTFTHTPTRPPLFPRLLAVLLGCCIESLGGPHCSPVLMHLLSLFSYSGNERRGALHWGGWWIGGRESDRATERERERDVDAERERRPGVSFVASAVKAQQGEPPWQFVSGATLIFYFQSRPGSSPLWHLQQNK